MNKENPGTTKTLEECESDQLYAAENYLNCDRPLTPKMISSLMHVGITYHATHTLEKQEEQRSLSSFIYGIGVLFVSIGIAFIVGSVFLYTHKIGPFYNPLEAAGK